MLYGHTPFRGKNRQKTFANILHKDLTLPSSIPVSLAARQLINALLQKDPASRLGSNTGANEIKGHPFFRGINWPLLRCMSPPPLDEPLQFIEKIQTLRKCIGKMMECLFTLWTWRFSEGLFIMLALHDMLTMPFALTMELPQPRKLELQIMKGSERAIRDDSGAPVYLCWAALSKEEGVCEISTTKLASGRASIPFYW